MQFTTQLIMGVHSTKPVRLSQSVYTCPTVRQNFKGCWKKFNSFYCTRQSTSEMCSWPTSHTSAVSVMPWRLFQENNCSFFLFSKQAGGQPSGTNNYELIL
jgi:hypothetical protein